MKPYELEDSICHFHKDYDFLNNKYHMKRIPFEGIDYPTINHAFLASKTNDEHLRRKIAVTHVKDLNRIFDIVGLRHGWHGPTMLKDLLEIKFGLVPVGAPDERATILKKLVATGNAPLVWRNIEHDNFYGVCICGKCDWVNGKNILGSALEATRLKLRGRIELRNSLKRKCVCQKEATRHLLWTANWATILTPSCDGCLAERVKYCLGGSTDEYIVPYPTGSEVKTSYIPIEKPEVKADSKPEPPIISDEEMYGEMCGYGMGYGYGLAQTVATTNKDERKWESFIWECG